MINYTTGAQDREMAEVIKSNMEFSINAMWVIEWVQNNLLPEETYSEDDLSKWAEANGYVKEE